MSARRATIRRERLQRNKVEKKKGKLGSLERAKEQDIIDGRALAVSVCLEVLHSKYKLSNNKAQQLLNAIGKESARFDNPGVRFVLEYYAEKIAKKINAIKEYQEIKDVETQIYCISRDDLYVTSVAIILTELNELFNFSSNDKNTGRLDYIMEYCANRFIEMQLDAEHKTVDYYYDKMVRKTGYSFLKR